MAAAKKAAEPEKPEEKPEPEKAEPKPRKDIWAEPCPVCGLLGCRRHAD